MVSVFLIVKYCIICINMACSLGILNERRKAIGLPMINRSRSYHYLLSWMIRKGIRLNKILYKYYTSETIHNYFDHIDNIEHINEPGQILIIYDFNTLSDEVPYYIKYADSLQIPDRLITNSTDVKQVVNMYFPFYLCFVVPDDRTPIDWQQYGVENFKRVTMKRNNNLYMIVRYRCCSYNAYKKKMKVLQLTPIKLSSAMVFPFYDAALDGSDHHISSYAISCK